MRALLEDGLEPGQVVVVEPDPARVREATSDGLAVVQGDGTRAEVLARAVVEPRGARWSWRVPRDDTAVLVALTVRAANTSAHLVAAVREAENAPLLRHSGADEVVVSSEAAGRLLGVAAASPATGTVITDLLEPGTGLEIVTRPVRPARGRPALRATWTRRSSRSCGTARRCRTRAPRPSRCARATSSWWSDGRRAG